MQEVNTTGASTGLNVLRGERTDQEIFKEYGEGVYGGPK